VKSQLFGDKLGEICISGGFFLEPEGKTPGFVWCMSCQGCWDFCSDQGVFVAQIKVFAADDLPFIKT